MHMKLTGKSKTTYALSEKPIGSGGEGDIYSVIGTDYVAKIYKSGALSHDVEEKLKIMIERPPNASVLSQVAWPLDLIYDGEQCRGFIMPKLSINAELGDIYKYPSSLPISAHQKINIAQNICVVISEVHRAGYVFGDFNPRNIGLDMNTGLVSFLDTDTYHVVDRAGGSTYRCNVCASGYAAPELLEKCSDYVAANPSASKNAYAQTPLPTFTQETDNFALAIHIFKLLMNGYTPFGGIIETASVSQASPGVGDAAVRRDSYCFRPGYKHQSAAIMPLETFPQEIADLFTRAFIIGKANPHQRPSAVEWYGALAKYANKLVTCPHNQLHQYDAKNEICPLCEADKRYTAVVAGDYSNGPLTQSTYDPPAKVAQTKAVQPKVVQVPSAAFVQSHNAQQPQVLKRQFLKVMSAIMICASISYIAFMTILLVPVTVLATGFGMSALAYTSINMGIVGVEFVGVEFFRAISMLILGIMGIRFCQDPTKTKIMRIAASISFIFVLLPLFWGFDNDLLLISSAHLMLIVLYLTSIVNDEAFLAQAPGSTFLKASGILLIIFPILNTIIVYVLGLWWVLGLHLGDSFEIVFSLYYVLFGVLSVRAHKHASDATMIQVFSAINIVIIFVSIYFSNANFGIPIMVGTLYMLIYIIPTILIFIGTYKNKNAMP